ncbi:MAG: PLDc N-terminal domain-containing protein [Phycisphaerae bacterium]
MLAAETADPERFATCFVGVLGLVGAGLGILAAVFWIGMTINVLFREEGPPRERIPWALVVIAVPLLGAAVYYFARFRPRTKRRRAEPPPPGAGA